MWNILGISLEQNNVISLEITLWKEICPFNLPFFNVLAEIRRQRCSTEEKTDLTLFYIHRNHYQPVNRSNDSNSITEWDEIFLFVYFLLHFTHLRAGTQPNKQISPNCASVRRQGEPCCRQLCCHWWHRIFVNISCAPTSDDKVGIMITLDLQCRADIILHINDHTDIQTVNRGSRFGPEHEVSFWYMGSTYMSPTILIAIHCCPGPIE